MPRQYSIRWRESDNAELSKAVKNFNAKVRRLAKKNPEIVDYLPETVSVRDIKRLIDTRQDLNRELNSLRRFSKRGAEEIVTIPDTDYNLKTTKWQKEDMTRRVAVINRRRKARLEEISGLEMTDRGQPLGYTRGQFGMGKADEVALSPMKSFTPKMTRTDLKHKHKSIRFHSRDLYFDSKDEQLRRNYIRGLERNYNPEDLKEIIKAIEDMDFKEFYKTWQSDAGQMEWASVRPNSREYDEYVTSLEAIWTPNKKPKGK